MNVSFVKSRCRACHPTLKPVATMNTNLLPEKNINIEDCWLWERFGVALNPIMLKMKFDGYPTLFLENVKVNHPVSASVLKNFMDGLFEKDKINPELPEYLKVIERRLN